MSVIGSQIIADVIVRGSTSAEAQLIGVGKASDSAASKLAALAIGGATLATAALIGVGAISLKMGADFQQGVNRLRTGAGDVTDSFASLSRGILQTSVDTGILTPALTKAMYEILSSGQRGAQAYDTLAVAARGAVIEQANVVDVSDTLAGTMTNFGTHTFGATQYMNGLMTAVARGRITLQNLSTAMGPIEPVAHAMGISFSDLAAAMSTQTNAAIPAARAATGLRFMMQALEVPTKKAKDAMIEWGLSSVDVANEMKVSLPGALQMIYDAAKRAGPEGSVPFNRAISDMVGGQRSLSAFLALTGTHMQDFTKNADAIAASMRSGSKEVNGWALAQSNLNVQADRARATLDAVFITIGTDLFPIASKFLHDVVMPAITNFGEWATTTSGLHDAFQVLANVAGTMITDFENLVGGIANFVGWVQRGGPGVAALAGSLAAIGTAIALIRFQEFAAGIYNSFREMQAGAGVVAELATKALPNLGAALDWTNTQAAALGPTSAASASMSQASFANMEASLATLSASVDSIDISLGGMGLAATEAATVAKADFASLAASFAPVDAAALMADASIASLGPTAAVAGAAVKVASIGMTASLAAATLGVSLLVGMIAAAFVMAQGEAGQMTASVKRMYDGLGTTAQDDQAKMAAAAVTAGDKVSSNWQHAGTNIKYALDNAKAQGILDAQKLQDALTSAAQRADAAWATASSDAEGNLANLLATAGWDARQIAAYMGGTANTAGGPPQVGVHFHAAGGLNIPAGKSWVGEFGPEIIDVPGGSNIYSHTASMGMMGGLATRMSAQPVINVYVQVDPPVMDGVRLSQQIMPHIHRRIIYGVGGFGLAGR